MVAEDGTLKILAAQASDTGRYTCRPPPLRQRGQQLQQRVVLVIVVFTPTVSVDYRFVFRVPMCDEMRMSQKASRSRTFFGVLKQLLLFFSSQKPLIRVIFIYLSQC